jgi:hypothetical protein
LTATNRRERPPAIGHTSHITPIPLLYHQYHYYTTNITSISFHYHSTVLLCRAPLVHAADRCERTACDCSAIARWRPHPPFSLASSPSAMAHAQNARAALRALAPSDIASRRRTTRSRRYGNRGLTYVRANSAASPRGAHSHVARQAKGWLEHEIRHAAETREHNRSSGIGRPAARMTFPRCRKVTAEAAGTCYAEPSTAGLGRCARQ